MEKYKKHVIIGSCVVALLIVFGAGLMAHSRNPPTSMAKPEPVSLHPVSKAELVKNNGKDGHDCFVAVDGTVYKIDGFALWQNGQHSTSNGQAYCGADMTQAINQSPHGRSKLQQLQKIGLLEN